MTPRSLFVIIIKIIGIFMLKDVIFSVVYLIEALFTQSNGFDAAWCYNMLAYAVAVAIYASFFYLLTFRSDVVIERLKLDTGFYEEQFSLHMDHFMLLRVAIIVAGLVMLFDAGPLLLKDTVAYYQNYVNNSYVGAYNYKAQNVTFSGARVIIAYILLVNSSYIASFVIDRNKKKTE